MHNVITDNYKKIRPEYQPTTVWMSELKQCLKWLPPAFTQAETSMPLMHSCSNDGLIYIGPLSSDAMFELVELNDACFVCLLLQDASHTSLSVCVNVGSGHFVHCF